MSHKKSEGSPKGTPAEPVKAATVQIRESALSLDGSVEEICAQARARAEAMVENVVTYTRTHPQQALLTAFAAGYVLQIVPTTRLLGGLMRLAAPLVKPALLLFGTAKIIARASR